MADAVVYDAVILGSGQGANPLAGALGEAGRKTALVESRHIGGTCINEGCTPTKTMVASARVAYLARRGADFGVKTGELSIDLARVRQRKRDIVDSFRGGNEKRLNATPNVDVLMGRASFVDARTVRVALNAGGESLLRSEQIFINTGTRTAVPDLPGLSEVPFLDNVSIMELDHVPDHLLILGGGYIGVEFGQMFRRFGSRVTIVQHSPHLLAIEDPDISEQIEKIFREDGIELLLNSRVSRASQSNGAVQLEVQGETSTQTVSGSHLLVAAGRRPNSDELNLPSAGIATDEHGYIRVNEWLETTAPGIYAIGDVKGGPAFTHISYDDFRVIRSNVLQGKRVSIAGRMVPYTVFTDPQLGRIGLTEQEARHDGRKLRIAKMQMTSVARALEMDESRGVMKILVDGDSDQILGAAVLGIEGGEVASMIQIAMMGNLPYTALRDGIFSHPTLSESLNNVFQKLGDPT